MRKGLFFFLLIFSGILARQEPVNAYTANKVWMEFRPNGRYRIYVNYTVPALREFREVYVEFSKKVDAEKFYFDVIRGADFHLPDAGARRFENPPLKPDPW